jgi:hypothetical protein
MTILERYLKEPVDESMMAGLRDADTVAVQSLRELIHEMAGNQFAVIEYLRQLAEQPPEVSWMILDAVPRMPADPHLVTLLRMLAQGEDDRLARGALEQLGRTRSTEAARALVGLVATLPPERAALAERGLRKLRLSRRSPSGGDVPEPELPEPIGWRALLSPVDGAGVQAIWFVCAPNAEGLGTLFGILCKDPEGIIASFGSTDVPGANLPPEQPTGSLHAIQTVKDAPPILLLEVPFDVGREAVREALALNWASGHPTPLEYRLLNPLIWEQRSMTAGEQGGKEEWEIAPPLPCSSAPLHTADPTASATLLDHPAFAGWFWQAQELYDAAERLGEQPGAAARADSIQALAQAHFGPAEVASLQRRLRRMAQWLTLATEAEAAALAVATAEQLGQIPPAESPFVRRLISIGLDVASLRLHIGIDPRRKNLSQESENA